MKKTFKIILSILILLIFFTNLQSQDLHFSQFTLTPLLINPAQSGADKDIRANANYKNQWGSVASPFKTYNVSYDMNFKKKNNYTGFSAVGLNIFNDKAGESNLNTFQANLSYAYHVYLSRNSTLGGGLYAAFGQRSVNFSGLQWGNQYDGMSYNGTLPSGELTGSENFIYLDFGGGIHFKSAKNERYMTGNDQRSYNAGISVFHVNSPKYSFYDTDERLMMKKVIYANALIGVGNSNLSIVPGFFYTRQGKAYELFLGSMFRYQFKESSKYTGFVKGSSISTGLHYRNRDALVASLYYEFSQYAIGVSYDINVSGLKTASHGNGGIEIALRFVSPNPFLYSKSRYY